MVQRQVYGSLPSRPLTSPRLPLPAGTYSRSQRQYQALLATIPASAHFYPLPVYSGARCNHIGITLITGLPC